jgi:very-short-patch-repair endonuclease
MRGENARRTKRARALRQVENEAEEILGQELRGRRLNGHKFVRQLPIGPYYADFACRQADLVVEVDGSQHARQPRDRFRDETMNANGWSVLRVWHVDVLRDREVVLDMVVAAVEGRMAERMISSEAKFLPASRRVEP